ncbi:MAG: hypothetical protein J0I54_12715 [Bosea sp.]|uniref:DpnI domain-containing protein n=1 Tax=unclassified Bosea (in: a-proteobacteria) TaxID=2653178 RepID=UPI000962F9F5|nr:MULTISPECIES: DpnI domain-containing protein [unclassified Bosea (in: a-proteobacteria)]MBN9457483.1 hypothetical protein [Bosea sp. (in: a-proteobacteria)]OJV09553.1 MAG: hypothetical protein BGO20_02410 [Bosea sp. 67-29]
MATARQVLGKFGEDQVVRQCACPRCKRPPKTLVRLPANFKCADVICDFCGYLGQIKASVVSDINAPPKSILGAAWEPQKQRMDAGIYFPLFLVLADKGMVSHAIYYLAADLQRPDMFLPRKPLSENARRAGWQGFIYDLSAVGTGLVRLR